MEYFYKNKTRKDGTTSFKAHCKRCSWINKGKDPKIYDLNKSKEERSRILLNKGYKHCTSCSTDLPLNDFYSALGRKDGKQSRCKRCEHVKKRGSDSTYLKSKDREKYFDFLNLKGLHYCYICKEEKSILSFYTKPNEKRKVDSYCKECSIKRRVEYEKEKRKIDPEYNLKQLLRESICKSIKRGKGDKEKIFGSSLIEILKVKELSEARTHIESLFEIGMTWDNHGDIWQLDHIIPLKLCSNKEDLIYLNQIKNLQPLWKEDNLNKSCKVDWRKPKKKYPLTYKDYKTNPKLIL